MKSPYEQAILKALIDAEIDYLITVPTSGVNAIYKYFENNNKCIYVTREEEGAALAAGISLGSLKPLLLIQQSGVGNMLNAIFTLSDPYDIPYSVMVLIRGEEDKNPIHHKSTRDTKSILMMLGGEEIEWSAEDSNKKFISAMNKKRWIYSHY